MNIERDNFIKLQMGFCVHDFEWTGTNSNRSGICKHCGSMDGPNYIDFSTWQDFGSLWDWSIKQDWWEHFIWNEGVNKGIEGNLIDTILINPDEFANTLYKFLKEKS